MTKTILLLVLGGVPLYGQRAIRAADLGDSVQVARNLSAALLRGVSIPRERRDSAEHIIRRATVRQLSDGVTWAELTSIMNTRDSLLANIVAGEGDKAQLVANSKKLRHGS
jgi:hypothetical protein